MLFVDDAQERLIEIYAGSWGAMRDDEMIHDQKQNRSMASKENALG